MKATLSMILAVTRLGGAHHANTPTRTVAAESKESTQMVEGVVMMASNSRLMITPDAGEVTEFIVAPTARVTRDGETTNLDSLQSRDHVVVLCRNEGQERIATEVIARSPL